MSGNENIVLNAAELIAQSDSMKTLSEDYNAMFGKVTSILNEMNDGWSENLSNNFSGKISVAQKGFAKIVEMLVCGQTVAKEAATSFEDINAIMARQISGAFSGLFEGLEAGGLADLLGTGINTDLIMKAMDNLGGDYSKVKDILGNIMGGDLGDLLPQLEEALLGTDILSKIEGGIDSIKGLFNGEISGDIIDYLSEKLDLAGVFEEMGFSDAGGVTFFVDMLKETFDKDNPIMQDIMEDMSRANAAWDQGNYLEAISGYALYSLEASSEIATDLIVDKGLGLVKNALDTSGMSKVIDKLPLDEMNSYLRDQTGIDFSNIGNVFRETCSEVYGERVQETVEGIPVVAGFVGEKLVEGAQYVGDLAKDAASFLGKLF